MKAVVFHDIGDIRLDEVGDPRLEQPSDAIVRITASAICGTDLHMIRGTMPRMKPGTVLGHEAVGIVEEVGRAVRNFRRGDRVVIPSTIACGYCSYWLPGTVRSCQPERPPAGTAFSGGPAMTGPFNGLQAEYARTPFAASNLVSLPDELDDDRAILLSDIFPTGWFGAELAEIAEGNTVAVFGCGPVGQFAIMSARLQGADRIIAIDRYPDRLEMAQAQGAEVIDFSAEDPTGVIKELTGGIGVDRVFDAVGVDAVGQDPSENHAQSASPEARVVGDHFVAGDHPFQALDWAVEAVAKAGTIGIVGVYPQTAKTFPIGKAMNKSLTLKMGNCNHRRIVPHLVDLVQSGAVDPLLVLTQHQPLTDAIEAYQTFDHRGRGWTKVKLEPAAIR